MRTYLQANAVIIVISALFFFTTFLVAADLFELSDREVMIALISSVVCGATILMVSILTSQVTPLVAAKLETPQ